MNSEYQTMNWNGMTLEITSRKDFLSSRLTGEEQSFLQVTAQATAQPLMRDTFPTALIAQAGGTLHFVDVMLSAEQYAA